MAILVFNVNASVVGSVEPLPFTITARKVAVTVKAQDITYGAALTQSNDDAVWEINNASGAYAKI